MRGKRHRHVRQPARLRIIPAHAGQTRLRWSPLRSCADHPRTCGANTIVNVIKGIFDWIIPAHAGQTVAGVHFHVVIADHPRTCGANRPRRRPGTLRNGSSPHMRGKLVRRRIVCRPRRIIPAHAGQTALLNSSAVISPDHPRTCGANGRGLCMARVPCCPAVVLSARRRCRTGIQGLEVAPVFRRVRTSAVRRFLCRLAGSIPCISLVGLLACALLCPFLYGAFRVFLDCPVVEL